MDLAHITEDEFASCCSQILVLWISCQSKWSSIAPVRVVQTTGGWFNRPCYGIGRVNLIDWNLWFLSLCRGMLRLKMKVLFPFPLWELFLGYFTKYFDIIVILSIIWTVCYNNIVLTTVWSQLMQCYLLQYGLISSILILMRFPLNTFVITFITQPFVDQLFHLCLPSILNTDASWLAWAGYLFLKRETQEEVYWGVNACWMCACRCVHMCRPGAQRTASLASCCLICAPYNSPLPCRIWPTFFSPARRSL